MARLPAPFVAGWPPDVGQPWRIFGSAAGWRGRGRRWSAGAASPARSTSLGVLQREHRISSQEKPPLIAWSMVGDGSIGSPSDHIRSFQLSQSSLSACWIIASPLARISADCEARMLAIARALPSSLVRALRSPPERGVG